MEAVIMVLPAALPVTVPLETVAVLVLPLRAWVLRTLLPPVLLSQWSALVLPLLTHPSAPAPH